MKKRRNSAALPLAAVLSMSVITSGAFLVAASEKDAYASMLEKAEAYREAGEGPRGVRTGRPVGS